MRQKTKRLAPTDAEAYRAMRLEALKQSPEAFGSTGKERICRNVEQFTASLTDDPDRFILGAYLDEMLIGLVSLYRHGGKKMAHKGNINQMYIAPSARGQGLSQLLIEDLIRRILALGDVASLILTVVVGNAAARALCLSLGFVVCGCEFRALNQGDQYYDEELMKLVL